jgi:hypothetical protein
MSSVYRPMVEIQQCCDAMKTMKEQGSIQPFTFGDHETGHMWVRGNNNEIRHYNEIKYCPFCGKEISISKV